MRGTGQRPCRIASLQDDPVLSAGRAHLFVEAAVAGQRGRRVPDHFQFLCGANGVPLLVRNDRNEIATTHHAGAGEVADRCLVDA